MTKADPKAVERKMEYVEITQAEEMPVLSAGEKAELIESLNNAQREILASGGVSLKPGEFGKWMRERIAKYRTGRKIAV